jgi:hypothetical protein
MTSTVRWASHALPDTKILVVPLICCPDGVAKGNELAAELTNVSFAPCLSLRPELFIDQDPQIGEPDAFSEIRDVIQSVQARLGAWQHHPYGFGGTGALVALYSNCPDNTLPLIHSRSDTWNPLFSRIRRS